MANIILHQFGHTAVGLKSDSGYVNATAMASGHKARTGQRKDVQDWLRLNRTQQTLSHLESITGIPVIELYQVFQGAPDAGGGTWIHPRLAIRFGIWLSDEFGLAVENWITDWQNRQIPDQPKLPCHLEAVQKADAIRHITDNLDDNPRLAQILIDHAINDIIKKSLPATANTVRGVVEIAHEMGYKTDDSSRVKLGKFVKAQGFTPQKEKRICNGVLTPINCYADTPELRTAIAAYFD